MDMIKQTINIQEIIVNNENPRFKAVKDEQQAINLMLINSGKEILNLATDIAKHGLNPLKNFLVEKLGSKFVPLEGNRRTVALKLLNNPELARGTDYEDKFKELHFEFSSQIPHNIDCVIIKDKKDAYKWVNLEHTGKNKGIGVVPWSHEQKQRFIAQYAGKKPSRAVQLIDFSKGNGIEYSGIDSSTLERLTGTPFVREHIGIEFKDGLLDLKKSAIEVIENLGKVFNAMHKDDFKVGDVYTSKKSIAWISKVLNVKSEDSGKEPTKGKLYHKQGPFDGDWINSALLTAYTKENRVKSLLKELKDLNPSKKVNVCVVSLRVLLELALYDFLREHRLIDEIIIEERTQIERANLKQSRDKKLERDWSPSFHKMLSHVSNNDAIVKDPHERRALQLYISKKSNEPFLTELNSSTHNTEYIPSPSSVMEIWTCFGKLIFKIILQFNANTK